MEKDVVLNIRNLFGGAINMHIPARFVDLSDLMPVPDHQEVMVDGETDQSLVVEIVVSDGW